MTSAVLPPKANWILCNIFDCILVEAYLTNLPCGVNVLVQIQAGNYVLHGALRIM